MVAVIHKNFDKPDEQHQPGRGQVAVVSAGSVTLRRLTFQPGWRWTEDVKPTAQTETCQIPHINVHIAGKLGVKMEDGSEFEFGPGDVSVIPPGHDAWVIDNEPVVIIEQTPITVV